MAGGLGVKNMADGAIAGDDEDDDEKPVMFILIGLLFRLREVIVPPSLAAPIPSSSKALIKMLNISLKSGCCFRKRPITVSLQTSSEIDVRAGDNDSILSKDVEEDAS